MNLLIVDDDPDILTTLKLALKKQFSTIETCTTPGKIPLLLNTKKFDLILLDMNFSRAHSDGKEGFHWLNQILEIDPSLCVVLITAYGDVDMAVRAIKHGATDFLLKPWNQDKLNSVLSSALKLSASKKNSSGKIEELLSGADTEFIAQSPAMAQLLTHVKKVAATDANVLLLGENGVGKDLIASAIHNLSKRKEHPFVKVDLGAVSETLFESELFGHKKGAFTDAKENRIGRFQNAEAGTLFLDEIGNLPMNLQAKLLTALQNRKITPLGSSREIPVNVRLITATNMPLQEMIGESRFRQDLLYRINTIELHVPPLRERKEDIAPLLQFFTKKFTAKYDIESKVIDQSVIKRLEMYDWPGNVRELEHSVERAVILSEGENMKVEDFIQSQSANTESNHELSGFNLNLDHAEKLLIEKALEKHQGNISRAAKDLGLTRAALYRRMEKHNL